MCFSKAIKGTCGVIFPPVQGSGRLSVFARFAGFRAADRNWKRDGEITGVEPAQVTDKLNKQAASSTEAPLDRSAASCLG